jgi:ubiquinone/menaquinone biosynthesis C-methylase UbiE
MSDDSDDLPRPKQVDVDPLLGLPMGTNHNSSGIEMVTLDPDTDTTDTQDITSSGYATNSPTDILSEETVSTPDSKRSTPSPDSKRITLSPDSETSTSSGGSAGYDDDDENGTTMRAFDIRPHCGYDDDDENGTAMRAYIKLPPTPEELEQAERLLTDQRDARLQAALAFAASTRESQLLTSSRENNEHDTRTERRADTESNARPVIGLLDSLGSSESNGAVVTPSISWGSIFQQSTSFLSSATKVVASSAVDISRRIGTEYSERVPEHVKEKINNSASVVVATTKVLAQRSADIFDKNVRPTIYNSTIGHFYTSELTRLLLLEIPANSTILDLGIGTAYSYCQNADLLKERKIKIIGIDIDESYILRARHSLIDYDLVEEIELICADIYKTDLDGRTFDYVVFSDSYAVIPNVNNMMRYCERFMKEYTGYMIVTSCLFDEYDPTLDRIKQNLKYVSAIEYGQLMLKSDLESYIFTERNSEDYDFKMIKQFNIGNLEFNSYIVRWRPGELQ